MKTYEFRIFETWLGGTKEKSYEIKAKTEAIAFKKINQIRGNRDWHIDLVVDNGCPQFSLKQARGE